ncbi:hypothetical protein IAI18_16080 [Acetobacteraceae bacterium H6797]|nr:hypothetical protein [Acetobacteraceae bacterium H6797]
MSDAWLMVPLALAGVVAALLLLARAVRGLGLAPNAPKAGRRLAVQEVLPIDAKRRAVLLRCDGREVLILTGAAGGDQVVGWLP